VLSRDDDSCATKAHAASNIDEMDELYKILDSVGGLAGNPAAGYPPKDAEATLADLLPLSAKAKPNDFGDYSNAIPEENHEVEAPTFDMVRDVASEEGIGSGILILVGGPESTYQHTASRLEASSLQEHGTIGQVPVWDRSGELQLLVDVLVGEKETCDDEDTRHAYDSDYIEPGVLPWVSNDGDGHQVSCTSK